MIDNTQSLLRMLENNELDFAVIEGVVDKSRYECRLYKKERFVGVCSKDHRFAGKCIPLEEIFNEPLLLREKGSGTRRILEQSLMDRGFSLESFARTVSLSNFSVIMELLEQENTITFAYRPIAMQREKLRFFEIDGIETEGEFNFVYCNKRIAEEKIAQFFNIE